MASAKVLKKIKSGVSSNQFQNLYFVGLVVDLGFACCSLCGILGMCCEKSRHIKEI